MKKRLHRPEAMASILVSCFLLATAIALDLQYLLETITLCMVLYIFIDTDYTSELKEESQS